MEFKGKFDFYMANLSSVLQDYGSDTLAQRMSCIHRGLRSNKKNHVRARQLYRRYSASAKCHSVYIHVADHNIRPHFMGQSRPVQPYREISVQRHRACPESCKKNLASPQNGH